MIEKYRMTGPRIGRSEWTGGYELLKNGSQRQKTVYVERIPTPTGEYEIHDWKKRAMEAAEEDGITELFDRIMEHIKDYRWLKTQEEREIYAMECMLYDSYFYWKDFTVIWM